MRVIQHIAEIHCDRCHTTDDLTPSQRTYPDGATHGGPRNVKPVGWSHVNIAAKVDLGSPVKNVRRMDLCPSCTKLLISFTDGEELSA